VCKHRDVAEGDASILGANIICYRDVAERDASILGTNIIRYRDVVEEMQTF